MKIHFTSSLVLFFFLTVSSLSFAQDGGDEDLEKMLDGAPATSDSPTSADEINLEQLNSSETAEDPTSMISPTSAAAAETPKSNVSTTASLLEDFDNPERNVVPKKGLFLFLSKGTWSFNYGIDDAGSVSAPISPEFGVGLGFGALREGVGMFAAVSYQKLGGTFPEVNGESSGIENASVVRGDFQATYSLLNRFHVGGGINILNSSDWTKLIKNPVYGFGGSVIIILSQNVQAMGVYTQAKVSGKNSLAGVDFDYTLNIKDLEFMVAYYF